MMMRENQYVINNPLIFQGCYFRFLRSGIINVTFSDTLEILANRSDRYDWPIPIGSCNFKNLVSIGIDVH